MLHNDAKIDSHEVKQTDVLISFIAVAIMAKTKFEEERQIKLQTRRTLQLLDTVA